jgi:hypothetical protein
MSLTSLMETIAKPLEEIPANEEKRGRKPSIAIDYDADSVDNQILTLARAAFHGMNFARLVMGFGHEISKSETTNRQIVGESLDRLSSRGLVKVSGTGIDRYVRAVNRKDFRNGDQIFVRGEKKNDCQNGYFDCFSDDEDLVYVVFNQDSVLIKIGSIESIVYRDGFLVKV